MNIDKLDRAILDLVQIDNLRSHANIGQQVGLSASAVRRRLSAMRDGGVIIGDVALTDPTQFGLTFMVHISFERESPDVYKAFRAQMDAEPAVSQCYSISGDYDFLLVAHAESPAAFESWAETRLMSNSCIGRYSTALVWSRTKFTTRVVAAAETANTNG